MDSTYSKTIFAFPILAMMLFAGPVHAASSANASISIHDLAHFNPQTFTFPGAGAFQFRPGVTSIGQGGSVTWTNNGYDEHTVTSYTGKMTVNFEGVSVSVPVPDGKFDSGIATTIKSGHSWTLDTTGLSPGDYTYFCEIHPWMQAVLRIATGGRASASVNIDHHQGDTSQFFAGSASWGFFPRTLNVPRGTQVTVSNDGHIFHTFSTYSSLVPFQEGFKTLMFPISDGLVNQTLAPGQSWTLDTGQLNAGTYNFACLFHPWMLGTVIIR
ncbi:hypothetical protein AUG19_09315 [archaeon 13_1_20CM_2_54_9]|nr:MAG: hypothetical protein AUJ07_08425 [Crenarchaeota archaeon 13_1_40CM_3_53_5]OLE74304.1 MAG: hypothetical protein AUG19_09315 [archaeon 13_1_20CM_2_54_9]